MKLNGVGKTMKHFKNISYASSTLYHHFRFRHEAPIFWFAIAFSWPLALHCLWHRQLFCLVSLACEQAPQVGGGKQKTGSNRKNIGERSEPSGGLGRGKGRQPFPSPDYPSALFARRFFPFSPNAEPGPRLHHLLFFNAARKMKKWGNWLLISAWNWVRVFI